MSALKSSGFDDSPYAQLIVAPYQDKILAVNHAASRLFKSRKQQLLQCTTSQLFYPSLPQLIVFSECAFIKGQAWSDDIILVNAQKKRLTIEISAAPICSTVTDSPALLFSFQDKSQLTHQREQARAHHYHRSGLAQWQRTEKLFQEIERENQLLLKAAGEGIYGVDAQGRTTFVNPAAERLLGWTADELVGKNIHQVIHHSHQNGSHYPSQQCPIYAAFQDGVVHQVDNEVFWCKNGRAIEVEYTSTPVLDEGRLVGAVVVFRDVSDRKNAEKKLRKALEEVEQLKQRLELENAYLQEELSADYNDHQIVGKSAAILHIIHQLQLVAPTDANVLITGESGTGKELIARAIHDNSPRRERALIRVNCAAIPADLFESEFFGHIKGAFSGAIQDRLGRFEVADGGTLFLDEVGEIPLSLQGKLLRVLQDQQFERVGDSRTRKVNVRVIAATNRDLKRLVSERKFREDLYFRLNVFPIESVPLRQRVEDIPLLASHFLQKSMLKFNKWGLKISLAQLQTLQQYHWPGNIRELENIIERQVIVTQDTKLHFDLQPTRTTPAVAAPHQGSSIQTEQQKRHQEYHNICQALRHCGGKIYGTQGAAHLLGLKPTTLASRMKKLGLDKHQDAFR